MSRKETDRKTLLELLSQMSTCLVASAIETFHVRLPNCGFVDSTIRSVFDGQPPVAGYAATVRIRTSAPPMEGGSFFDEGLGFYGRTDWWDYLLTIPRPRVVIIEDLDKPPGRGAFVGEVHANVLMAMGCTALVTNGAVRDLGDIAPTGFQMFATTVSVSHAYAHVLDFGGPVQVGGLTIQPNDLIHADRHGIQTIPLEVSEKIPAVALEIRQRRHRLIQVARSADFSLERLRKALTKPDPSSQGPPFPAAGLPPR